MAVATNRRRLCTLAESSCGAATLEFALIFAVLIVVMLNGVEIARWYNSKMELDNATQMAAQAAWASCDTSQLPATTNCPNLNSSISTALKSTTLGALATLSPGSPAEGYYCLAPSGNLVFVSSASAPVTDCSSIGVANQIPSDDIVINAYYTYTPIFNYITVGRFLPSNIQSFSWVRLK